MFYNISPPNLAILLISGCSFFTCSKIFCSSCQQVSITHNTKYLNGRLTLTPSCPPLVAPNHPNRCLETEINNRKTGYTSPNRLGELGVGVRRPFKLHFTMISISVRVYYLWNALAA